MEIIRDTNYLNNLEIILDYIAQDSLSKLLKFLSKIDAVISNIPSFPYKYRQSLYYDDSSIRDFIYKGYTIPYLIDKEKNLIVLLDIFKWSKR